MEKSAMAIQRIDGIISELKMIMQESGITQTGIVSMLDGKCSRNTIISFFNKSETDPRLTTLLMILDACGVKLRLDTERSREAIISGDIEAYRVEVEKLRATLEDREKELAFFRSRYTELIDKNTVMTRTIDKQQAQIEKYMTRMENAENAIYEAQGDIRRKDARIVELQKKLGLW